LQAAISDYVSFDPFSFQQAGLGVSEVDISRGVIAQEADRALIARP